MPPIIYIYDFTLLQLVITSKGNFTGKLYVYEYFVHSVVTLKTYMSIKLNIYYRNGGCQYYAIKQSFTYTLVELS